MNMEENVGDADAGFRLIISFFIALFSIVAIVSPNVIFTIIGILGLIVVSVLTVTAFTRKCPANNFLGIDTASA